MKTNIVIDDELMNEAIKAHGYKTEKETIEAALKLLIAQGRQAKIRKHRGTIYWEGDLDAMRSHQ